MLVFYNSVSNSIRKKPMQKKIFILLSISFIYLYSLAGPIAAAQAHVWKITQLTNNSFRDASPETDGSNIVWAGSSGLGGLTETYFFNGSTVAKLPGGAFNNYNHQISGGKAVWRGPRSADPAAVQDIFFYNGSTVTTLPIGSTVLNYDPHISGNNVVWSGDARIYLYNGSSTTKLNDVFSQYPQVSGDKVAWQSNLEIGFYNGSTVNTFPGAVFSDYAPQIDGNKIAWYGQDAGAKTQVYFYDGSTAVALTNNPYNSGNVQISGNNVVWDGEGGVAGASQIYMYNGSQATTITNTAYDNWFPQISGKNVVWQGSGGPGGTGEIYFYDGSSITRLTDNAYEDSAPQMVGNKIVWHGGPGGSEEVFAADIDDAAPATAFAAPKISTSISKTTRFKVSWLGADPAPASGVAAYDIQYKVNKSGAWTDWKVKTIANSDVFKGATGKTYYFRARAVDVAGNAGNWSSEARTIVPNDNNKLIASRSGFGSSFSKASSKFYKGTVRYSNAAGEYIVYKFSGNYVALIGTKGKGYSRAQIWIDGKLRRTVNAKARKMKYREVLFERALKNGKHKIKIVNLATGGASRFDVDGLAVGR